MIDYAGKSVHLKIHLDLTFSPLFIKKYCYTKVYMGNLCVNLSNLLYFTLISNRLSCLYFVVVFLSSQKRNKLGEIAVFYEQKTSIHSSHLCGIHQKVLSGGQQCLLSSFSGTPWYITTDQNGTHSLKWFKQICLNTFVTHYCLLL